MQYDEYISRFSHELRNPLTLIYSSLQLLEKECPAVRETVLWEQIRKDMRDVIQLLKDMSAPFSRFQMAPMLLSDFFSELSLAFIPSMKMRGICFTTELPDELSGTTIIADRQKLRQAVTNLIVNAQDAVSAQASPDSSALSNFESKAVSAKREAPARIRLYAVKKGTNVCIHVRDNGPGIPQEYLVDLFDPFVTHKPNGSGLGLSIAQKIAEQHGGCLTVDSRTLPCAETLRSYTDFCLRLPIRRSNE